MSWDDEECPSNSFDAYRQGRSSRSYDRNPYEHGQYSDNYDCRQAYDEWERGHRSAEYERREEAEAAQWAEEQRARAEAEYQRMQEEELMNQYYQEPEYLPPDYDYPEPEGGE